MTRPWIATIVLLLVAPARLSAQSAEFRVDTASASVHKAPSIASPVIGHARQGVALEVTRDLGSWVKVPWPDASGGIGYIHVSMGTRIGASLPRVAVASVVPAGEAAAASQSVALWRRTMSCRRRTSSDSVGSSADRRSDRGSTRGPGSRSAGAAARGRPHLVHRSDRFRSADRDSVCAEPPVLPVESRDRLRVGSALPGSRSSLVRQSLGVIPPGGVAVSRSSVGVQTFGGGEFTFASVPRFSVSADLRYGWINEHGTRL